MSRKQGSWVCTVLFPPASILPWQQPVTITGVPLCIWVLLLVSSAGVVFFYMRAVFLLLFSCILDTLFFQPELDIVLPAYVPACNDWLWQKRYLPPLKKKRGGGQWWPLRQLPFTISHASASPCNFISYCLCPSYLFSPLFTGNVKPFSFSPQLSPWMNRPLIP